MQPPRVLMEIQGLDKVAHTSLEVSHDTWLPLILIHLHDARTPLFLGNTLAADQGQLFLSHTSVDIDILDLDPDGAVARSDEPRVNLPAEIQEDEQGTGEVELEEVAGVEVGAADGVERDVELGHQADDVDEEAEIGTPDAEGGAEWDLIEGAAVEFPVQDVNMTGGNRGGKERRLDCLLTRPYGSEYAPKRCCRR